jgi:hypothetical protein
MILTETTSGGNEDEGYSLRVNIPLPSSRPAALAKTDNPEVVDAADKPTLSWRPMQPPPPGLFLKAVLSLPFRTELYVYVFSIAVLCIAIGAAVLLALYFGNVPRSNPYAGLAWFATALLTMVGAMLVLSLLFALSGIGLAILCDASEGLEKLINKPRGMIIDWIEETGFILFSIFFGSLPAAVLLFFVPDRPEIKMSIIILSETILFPVFLLSSLANGSIPMLYSKPVWRSMGFAWHAWTLFYLFTLLLGESLAYCWQLIPHTSFWSDVIILAIFLPFFWITYFRLLGRLAWFCSGGFDEKSRSQDHDHNKRAR